MPDPLLVTKISLPRLRNILVPRNKVLRQLSEGVQEGYLLTLVSAPAGFGKTTTIRMWVEVAGYPVAWVTLEKSDNDLKQFLTYVLTALGQAGDNLGQAALEVVENTREIDLQCILGLQATIFRCPNCGAELRFEPAGGGARPGCPYDGLSYAELRARHDALYIGEWRKIEASPFDVRRAHQQLRRHLDFIAKALDGQDLPAARRNLALAVEAHHGVDPTEISGNDIRLLDNALSFVHRVIDDLLHEKGLPPHCPMDFAEWYDAVEIPFRDAW